MNRQEANKKILAIVEQMPEITKIINEDPKAWDLLVRVPVNEHPQLRFGQILCNWFCIDYRCTMPCEPTITIMETLFPGNPDPFYEESTETLKRLTI